MAAATHPDRAGWLAIGPHGGEQGQNGKADTYRIRLSNGYDSGEQPLTGGNIKIHIK